MRLTLNILGFELDLSIGLATTDEPDPLRDLGTTGCYPISFTAHHTVPAEADGPWRTPAWDEPEE